MPRRLLGIRLLLAGLALALAPTATAGDGGLPPPACVALLRSARLAQLRGDAGVELEKLRAAAAAFPAELAPLYALLDYHRRQPLSEADHHDISARLVARLASTERPLPAGFLSFLADDPDTDPAILALTLDHLASRLAAAQADDPELLAVRARLEGRLGRDADAVETLERLYRSTREPSDLWQLLTLYLRLERWSDAVRSVDQMTGEDWQVPATLLLDLVSKAGDVDRTLALAESLAATPETAASGIRVDDLGSPIRDAAWRLRDRDQDAAAERLFRRALVLHPEDPELHGVLLHLYGSEDERQAHAEAIAESWGAEEDPNALLDEGTRRLSTGDAAGAIELLRRAATHFPDLEAVWYNLGTAAYRLEDWETTASALERAAALNPGRAQSPMLRGIALAKLGRCREAIAALELALSLDPAKNVIHYHLYDCHTKLGDGAAAKASYARWKAGGGP